MLHLAWRNLWRHARRTAITLVSIAVGLAFVVFFIALAEGVYAQLVDDAVRMQAGHVTIEHEDYRTAPAVDLVVAEAAALRERVDAMAGVAATKLLASGQGIARSGRGAVGVSILGVEPDIESRTSPLAEKIVTGRYLEDGDRGLVVLGQSLAERLHLEIGSKLVLASNDRDGNLVEQLFRVAGTFRSGSEEIDGYLVETTLADTRRLFALDAGDASQIGVLARPGVDPYALAEAVAASLPARSRVVARPWQEVLPELAAFIRLDRVSDRVFQSFLVLLVLSTILNTLLMSVLEREHELAVMMAVGTTRRRVATLVFVEAAMMAALGCLFGLAAGAAAAGWVQVHGWDLRSLYGEGVSISGLAMSPILHARVTAKDLAGIGLSVFVATLLLALVPVRRAAQVVPTRSLR